MKKTLFLLILFLGIETRAQIPTEIFFGNEKATLDLMFFKFFKKDSVNYSPWLFFNRNRASVDYRFGSTNVPLIGFTEAISYNYTKLKGFAPVYVIQILSWGLYSKTGIQYAKIGKNFTLFTWLVTETNKDLNYDYFVLYRYTPSIGENLKLFTQLESINAFYDLGKNNIQLTQRARLGLQKGTFQFGFGVDLNQQSRLDYKINSNLGIFIRNEF